MASDKIILFPLNLDAMLRACVPGGSSCDPQNVSDAIREWVSTELTKNQPVLPPWIDVSVADELTKRLLLGEKVIWRHAFRWQSDTGPLPNHYEHASAASLAAEFGYQVIVDAGCAAIIRDPKASVMPRDAGKEGQSRLFAKGLKAIQGAMHSDPAIARIPADWLGFVMMCAEQAGKMISGNELSNKAKSLLNAAADAPKPATNRSWWKDVKPETDLAEANDVIGCMLEDWQKVGEALGFKDFADPESIIGVCTGLFEGAPMAAAEAIVLLNGVIAKLERDDEYGLEPDLREALRLLTYGATHAKGEPSRSDEFADIREFRRREAEMDRQDAERAAKAYEAAMRGMFPCNTDTAAPHISGGLQPFPFDGVPMDGSIPVYGGDPEFDALPIGAGNFPEAPVPMAAEPTWKRDEEKTMLRILLLSADTTGFHGNDPAVHLARIAKWTDDECRAVDDWCVAMHLHAGDRGVRVPPKPIALVSERPAVVADPMDVIRQALEPVSAEEFERLVLSIIVAETRYPMHHFTRAAKMITELHARGTAE